MGSTHAADMMDRLSSLTHLTSTNAMIVFFKLCALANVKLLGLRMRNHDAHACAVVKSCSHT